MQRFSKKQARRRVARALGFVAGALLFGSAVALSEPAVAGPGGGFHGGFAGGTHGGFAGHGGFGGGARAATGGLRPGGSRAGDLPALGMHSGFAAPQDGADVAGGGHWFHGWRDGRDGWWWGSGLGWSYYPFPVFGADGYPQPVAAQYWYCADPPGYYPYVSQCGTAWQTSPAD